MHKYIPGVHSYRIGPNELIIDRKHPPIVVNWSALRCWNVSRPVAALLLRIFRHDN